jgi:predicted protein tyrosine phosphatase
MPRKTTFTTGKQIKRFLRDPGAFDKGVFCYDLALVVNRRVLGDNDDLQSIPDDATVEIRHGFVANLQCNRPSANPGDALASWFNVWLRTQPEHQVQVLSRQAAHVHRPGAGSVCISITNPRQSPQKLEDGWAEILRLGFHDTDRPGGNYVPMTKEQALEILELCHRHRDAPIVVHCEFGHSRSPGIGAFIAAWLDRDLKLNTDVLNPNPWVIRQLRRHAFRLAFRWRDWRLLKVALHGPLSSQYRYRMLPAGVADSYR